VALEQGLRETVSWFETTLSRTPSRRSRRKLGVATTGGRVTLQAGE
jgi:hypothetical protein